MVHLNIFFIYVHETGILVLQSTKKKIPCIGPTEITETSLVRMAKIAEPGKLVKCIQFIYMI